MVQEAILRDRILELVKANLGCTLEQVTQQFPDLHWYAVYIEVERLCRSGHLRLIHDSVLSTTRLHLP